MKVKSLMLAGFGTVAGLLLLVALGSAVGLAMSSALFNDYEGMAEDTNLTARIMGTTMTARMSTKKFLETSDQIQVENFRSDMANLDQLLARADREITSPARRVQLSHIKEQSSTYRDAFENVVSLVRQREQLITEKLNRHGLAAADAIAAVLNAMTKRGSASDVYAAAMVQETLLSLRLSVFKYLSTGQSGALDDARVQLDQLPAQLNSLNKRVRGTEATAAIDQFEASVSVYRRSIDELANIVSSQNNAVFAVLDKVGPAIV